MRRKGRGKRWGEVGRGGQRWAEVKRGAQDISYQKI